jgi:hypothetical protein
MIDPHLLETMQWVLSHPDDRLGPYGTTYLYGPDDWLEAAEQADYGDFTDLRHMVERSELLDEYLDGTDGDGRPWRHWDFEDFFDVMKGTDA